MSSDSSPVLDTSTVFAIRDDVAWVAIGDEVVVHRPIPPASFVLNAVAALLWRCLDGLGPTSAIVADIADAFSVDPVAVETDCLPVIGVWLDQHLIEVVGP